MKMRTGHLLILLLISLVATPAFGAMYDATGQWSIQADPGQELFIIDVPTDPFVVDIEQFENDTFTVDIVGSKKDVILGGKIKGDEYYINVVVEGKDKPLAEDRLDEIIEDYLQGIWTFDELYQGKFLLSSEHELSGNMKFHATFSLNNITFTGSAVPVPAAVWLLGSGMAALFGIRKWPKD